MPDKPSPAVPVQPVTEAHLPSVVRELYVEKRHSDQEIADALGVDRVTVTKWRKRWGITRDDRPAVAL